MFFCRSPADSRIGNSFNQNIQNGLWATRAQKSQKCISKTRVLWWLFAGLQNLIFRITPTGHRIDVSRSGLEAGLHAWRAGLHTCVAGLLTCRAGLLILQGGLHTCRVVLQTTYYKYRGLGLNFLGWSKNVVTARHIWVLFCQASTEKAQNCEAWSMFTGLLNFFIQMQSSKTASRGKGTKTTKPSMFTKCYPD